MKNKVKVALAQVDMVVGDVPGNTARILEYAVRARDELHADLVVFPELSVCGYPPEDLLFHAGLRKRAENAVTEIRDGVRGIAVLIGFPEYVDDRIHNSCAVFADGRLLAGYRKRILPNYRVFDEERYFKAGREAAVFRLNGIAIGLAICEDVWQPGPLADARSAGAECIIAINGSPYELESQQKREGVVRKRVAETAIPVVYVNTVGGQDELVFDGGSFVMDADGDVTFRAPAFEEGLHSVMLLGGAGGIEPEAGKLCDYLSREASVYGALITGTRDYVRKHGFPGVIIGLSGGIDSALVLAIASDAVGRDKVRAVMMPFRYTSNMSQEDAQKQARLLGVRYDVIPIAPIYDSVVKQLAPVLEGAAQDATEENIQARCRGLLLMAISNKTGRMLADHRQQERDGRRLCDALWRHGRGLCADQGLQQDTRLPAGELPELIGRCNTGARHHPPAVRRAPAGTARQRFTATVRGARSDTGVLHRAGPLGRGDRSARLRTRDGDPGTRTRQAQRIQAPAGTAGHPHQQQSVRAGLALSDHVGICLPGLTAWICRT